ncbi:MAG TPA: phenylalanine--tRNA ligase beta subunit-related protein [Geobacterales bacterium]|nr:phenylalanine--tRNA ligase beta subunit-related protein [Geobacterales bacterium]
MELRIEEEARELGIFLFLREIDDVEVKQDNNIEEKLKEIEIRYSNINPDSLKEDPIVKAYREFYWRIGVDPTKIRPSGEALRRRIARGNKLPRINNIVDAGNIASVVTLVPIGIYDKGKIIGNLRIKLSNGEEFLPIGADKAERVPKGMPILVDEENKVIHLYPHRDSSLTKVTENTKALLIISAGVPFIDRNLVKEALLLVSELIKLSCPNAKFGDIVEVR